LKIDTKQVPDFLRNHHTHSNPSDQLFRKIKTPRISQISLDFKSVLIGVICSLFVYMQLLVDYNHHDSVASDSGQMYPALLGSAGKGMNTKPSF